MKNFILILLLILPLAGQAQMKVMDYDSVIAYNTPVTFRHYIPETPSDYYLIFLHGSGEKGPINGTKLNLVEKHGYPMHAKNGYKFPFNIIALQSAYDHRKAMAVLPQYIKTRFKAKVIIVTGLSMGGYGTYDAWLQDELCLIYAFAPVCGAGRLSFVKDYRNAIVWHFHNDGDPVVKWNSAKGFIDAFNNSHGGLPIKISLFKSSSHDAWSKAYSVTPGQDDLLQQIIKWFAEAYKEEKVIDLNPLQLQAAELLRMIEDLKRELPEN